uniref:Uncharacterized protein n=1 Tax=Anguilla anguilla TaxID=7936 RepID=A0A0E9W4E5_ANGAN
MKSEEKPCSFLPRLNGRAKFREGGIAQGHYQLRSQRHSSVLRVQLPAQLWAI